MTLARILQLVLLGITALLMLAVGVWFQKCRSDRELDKRPPAEIEEDALLEDFDREADLSLPDRILIREVPVRARGRVTTPETIASRDSFIAAATDSGPPRWPHLDIKTSKDGLESIGAVLSDGSYERRDFDCDHPCTAGARDTTVFAHTPRAIPRLLPDVLKTAGLCAAAGAAGYGIARVAKYEEPILPGVALATGCVLLRIY